MPRRALLSLVVVAGLWGASYLFIAVALGDGVTPAVIVTVRVALGACVALALAPLRDVVGLLRRHPLLLVALALLQYDVPLLLLGVGQEEISSALAGTLVAATPVFVVALAPLTGGVVQSRRTWAGVLVALGGVALLLGLDPSALGTAGTLRAALVVLVALSYALAIVLAGRGFPREDKPTLLAAALSVAAVLSLPASVADPGDGLPGPLAVAALATLGLLGTGLAFVLFYRAIGSVGPERAALVTYLAPVFAVTYGVVLLGEDVGGATVVGLVLVLVGARVAAGRRSRPRRDRSAGHDDGVGADGDDGGGAAGGGDGGVGGAPGPPAPRDPGRPVRQAAAP